MSISLKISRHLQLFILFNEIATENTFLVKSKDVFKKIGFRCF
jgi:hypothetical protein